MLKFIKRYVHDESAVAAVEAAMMFPTLVMMLVSMVDIGNGIVANQKLVTAAETTADLITREANPTLDQRADAITAGKMAMSPFSLSTYEYNVASIAFDNTGSPDIVWEDSSTSSVMPQSIVNNTTDLGNAGEGVVVVMTSYTYEPFFTGFLIGPIHMQEEAYMRGRKSAVVGLPL